MSKPQPDTTDPQAIEKIQAWYQAHSQTATVFTSIATACLVLSGSLLATVGIEDAEVQAAIGAHLWLLLIAWAFLAVASISALLSRSWVYRWLAAAMSAHFRDHFGAYPHDDFQYTPPARMRVYGRRTALADLLFAYTLALGIAIFSVWVVVMVVRLYG